MLVVVVPHDHRGVTENVCLKVWLLGIRLSLIIVQTAMTLLHVGAAFDCLAYLILDVIDLMPNQRLLLDVDNQIQLFSVQIYDMLQSRLFNRACQVFKTDSINSANYFRVQFPLQS